MGRLDERARQAIAMTAPGTALRTALDMIIAARLGALICIGDTERVLATGNDGFPLSIAFTSHRLFELSKMDGAIVVDDDLSTIVRANFHLNPDSTLPTSETGMRHRTAARMSMATDALIVSVSERRAIVSMYLSGKNIQLKNVNDLINEGNQFLSALEAERTSLDAHLRRITSLEFDDYVTLTDLTTLFAHFQSLQSIRDLLDEIIMQLGNKAEVLKMQAEQLTSNVEEIYTLTIRDYAAISSADEACRIKEFFAEFTPRQMNDPQYVAEALGYPGFDEDTVITPRGMRTLSRVSTITNITALQIAEAFGNLPALIQAISQEPELLSDFGVSNPSLVLDSLYRMWGKRK